MIEVQVRGGNLEKAMRVLKKKVMKEGIVKELKRRRQRIYTMSSFFIHKFVKLKKSNHQTKYDTKYQQNWLRFHH